MIPENLLDLPEGQGPQASLSHLEPPAGEVVENVFAEERFGESGPRRPDAAERRHGVVAGRLVHEHEALGADAREQRHVHHFEQPLLAVLDSCFASFCGCLVAVGVSQQILRTWMVHAEKEMRGGEEVFAPMLRALRHISVSFTSRWLTFSHLHVLSGVKI